MVHVWCIIGSPLSNFQSAENSTAQLAALTKVLVQENSKMWRLASKVSSDDRCNDNRKQDIGTWSILGH